MAFENKIKTGRTIWASPPFLILGATHALNLYFVRPFLCILLVSVAAVLLGSVTAHPKRPTLVKASVDPWAKLPFTAREWARQALLPYRKIPLKDGGTMDVQKAYDLYLAAGQPDYPDMGTPGLVSQQELAQQVKLSKKYNRKI